MRLMQRFWTVPAAVLIAAISLWTPCQKALGQGGVPSADQIEIFRSLSPDQQDAILKQLGSGASGGGALGGLSSGGGERQQGDRERPRNQQDLNDQARIQNRSDSGETNSLGIPTLTNDDWVIVEIDFHLPPRPAALALQQLYALPGVQTGQSLQGLPGSALAGGLAPQQAGALAAAQQQQQQTGQSDSDLTESDRRQLLALMEMIRSKNPYQLGRDGSLSLPGFTGIALAGLTEEQATLRLKVEPAFRRLDVRVTRLPLKKSGAQALKPFGYDLFDKAPSTFAPVTNVPVPSDYVIGAGDELDIQLYGNQNRNVKLVVSRDGTINFPDLGPINVAGQRFTAIKSSIEQRVARQMIGVQANVSMGDTRSIRVFVLGEAKRPGSYTISGLGTITSALFASGGVSNVGSLRKIELKRQGTVVRQLDLYDLLIRGDTTDDTKLLQGDVIFIPSVGPTVSVDGEVRRPAIYEIKNESNVSDLVRLAGGLSAEANTGNAVLTRINANQQRVAIHVDPTLDGSRSERLLNGDLLLVPRLKPTLDSGVTVQGHVFTPGVFAYRDGLRLSDVIHSVDELRPDADLHYLLIRRELPPDRRIAAVSADLAAALKAPGSPADVQLMQRDRIIVFDLASGRDRIIKPVLDELRLQSGAQRPTEVVHIDGRVKVPGEYPLETSMTVADLIRAGGGLADAAYGSKAELTRYQVVNGEMRRTELIDVDLAAALRGEPVGNIRLEPFDNLSIKEVQQWQSQESVSLTGEVRFPGNYAIRRGETLKSVIQRAGGLTDFAFPEGSVFTRDELKKREQEQIDMLSDRMQRDLALLALQNTAASAATGTGGGGAAALSVGQSLLSQLRGTKAVGRLVIDLPRTLQSPVGSPTDVILRGGDNLIIPRFQQQVTVIGEVQNQTSHLYSAGLTRDDYISLSGGMTRRADHKKIYVVRANGNVYAAEGNRWFENSSSIPIKPGDTIVVPLDAERIPPLPFWTAVTTIIYNVAIAAAAVHSF